MSNFFETQNIIFVTGKGGVGKSTVAAALALSYAEQGFQVLLAETDTYSALEEAFGVELKDDHVVETKHGVDIINLRTETCLEHTLNRFVPGERIARAVANNRIASAFFDAAPSVSEFVLLNRIFEYTEKSKEKDAKKYAKIVVDLPASGHAVTLLNVPRTLEKIMRGVGPVAARAKEIAEQIEDPTVTAIVAVCIPEEMPVTETIELSVKLEEALGRPLSLVAANMVHTSPLTSNHIDTLDHIFKHISQGKDPSALLLEDPKPIDRLFACSELGRRWHQRDLIYLKKLHQELKSPIIEFQRRYTANPFELLEGVSATIQSHSTT